jgi:Tfp pilus assembly protein FimT
VSNSGRIQGEYSRRSGRGYLFTSLLTAKGSTLAEYTVVLLLSSIFLTTTIPYAQDAFLQLNTRLFVDQMCRDLQLAASEAIAKQRETEVRIDRINEYYAVNFPGDNWRKVSFPANYQVLNNFTGSKLTFSRFGQISQGGTIWIRDVRGRTTSIVVQLSSGRFYVVQQ